MCIIAYPLLQAQNYGAREPWTTIPATANFDQATQDVRKLKRRPEDEELKELYGLYKQSIIGDINIGACPVMLDMKGKAKWEAWNLQKGLSKEDAMSAYISKARELIEKYGIYNLTGETDLL